MAANAPSTLYREEFIPAFEYGQSMLRTCCVTEMQRSGNQAVFLVAGSGGAEAVTRGVDGKIPSRHDDNTQLTATLAEWHDKPIKTGFNVFESQGDQRRIMQQTSLKVLNRKIDADIIAQLDTATLTTGAAVTASLDLITKSLGILGSNEVDVEEEDNMFAVISPAFRSYLMQVTEFTNGEYVEVKPLNGPVRKMWRWSGLNWITHPRLTGAGTSSEDCFMFHRNSIGHAADTGGMTVAAGYDDEDDYSYARCSMFMGSKLLQNTGVIKMIHDASAIVAS